MKKSLAAGPGETAGAQAHAIQRQDLLALGAMMLLWGLSWPAMKASLQDVPPLWLATLRFASAAVCLFLIQGVKGHIRLPSKADMPIVASVGLLQMMAFTALGVLAMQRVGAGHAALLAYTTPLWVTLLSAFLPGRVGRADLLAVGFGVVGIAVICLPDVSMALKGGTDKASVWGDAMLLVAAVCWASVILHVRRHRWRAPPLALAPWQMLTATVPLAIAAAVFEGVPTIHWSLSLLGLIAFIGPVGTCICFIISTDVGRRIPSVTMSLATLGVPVVGLLTSMLVLHETASVSLIAGLLLIAISLSAVLLPR
jgi:drug/metabolite transporter (DMT)-like permease